ncbi:MAG: hypothetical protein KatS3mg131_3274 [Candidatus Tectimicrobiota bacterium]|nr:MAG: hypothetical protein KatS3mg131_3274 [Candidatus Tectomicrobia bacterium]
MKRLMTLVALVAFAVAVALPVSAAYAAHHANPCAAGMNPCAAKANPCAAKNPCNPCAAKMNPCAAKNPCNPCAAKNPCGTGGKK